MPLASQKLDNRINYKLFLYNFSVCLLNSPCQELSYEISGDNAALYIIIFFLIENFTMAIALTAASGRSMGSWWLL